jgi:hypothetical protein
VTLLELLVGFVWLGAHVVAVASLFVCVIDWWLRSRTEVSK